MTVQRTYKQYCGLAAALDVIGERWTLLIIRELLAGPKRYGELIKNLTGIGTNLLAERLKFLAEKGVIEKTSGTGKRQAYALTELGESLRPTVLGLARWGLDYVGDLPEEYEVRASWGLLAVEAMIEPTQADRAEQYEFRIDDEVFHVAVTPGAANVVAGPAASPIAVVVTDGATFVRIGAGALAPFAALASGKLKLDGDPGAIMRACALLQLDTGISLATGRGTAPPQAEPQSASA
ncbi:MAG: winged helix-turn-helix transcriptional regulator [Pseudomonadota bacterium]